MKSFLLAVVAAALLGACATHLIPNTDLDDTQHNRELVEFCERYRHAVQNSNVPELIGMAHPDYYEDGGNVDATDDLDYAGLEGYLKGKFSNARAIRYEVRYRRVSQDEQRRWNVAYTYSASYKLPDGSEEVWHRRVSENQLTLVPSEDSYLIISGM